jgi:hypothetical protein
VNLPPGLAVMAAFFLHAASASNIYSRIPDIQERLGLSSGQLGLALSAKYRFPLFRAPL